MIGEDDLNLYKVTESCQDAVDEVLQFFTKYHSMRYVRNKLVLRVSEPLPEGLVDQFNQNYQDILANGRFEYGGALPEEADEPELADMGRLSFAFDRRSLGRLRRLIDCINAGRLLDTD